MLQCSILNRPTGIPRTPRKEEEGYQFNVTQRTVLGKTLHLCLLRHTKVEKWSSTARSLRKLNILNTEGLFTCTCYSRRKAVTNAAADLRIGQQDLRSMVVALPE